MRKSAELRFFGKLLTTHLFLNPIYMKKVLVASFAVLLLVVGTTFMFQPGVTRGDALYPIKQAAESMELFFTRSPLSRVNTHLKFADRRMEELKLLLGARREAGFISTAYAQGAAASALTETPAMNAVSATLADMVNSTESAMQTAEAITNPQDAKTALSSISQAQGAQVQALDILTKGAPAETQLMLEQAALTTATNQAEVVEVKVAVDEIVQSGQTNVTIEFDDEDGDEDDSENLKEFKEDAEEEIKEAQEKIEKAKRELAKASAPDAQKLVAHAEDTLAKAVAALAAGNFGEARGLAKASQSLAKNAIKAVEHDEDEDKDEDVNEDDDKNEKVEEAAEEAKEADEKAREALEGTREEAEESEEKVNEQDND